MKCARAFILCFSLMLALNDGFAADAPEMPAQPAPVPTETNSAAANGAAILFPHEQTASEREHQRQLLIGAITLLLAIGAGYVLSRRKTAGSRR